MKRSSLVLVPLLLHAVATLSAVSQDTDATGTPTAQRNKPYANVRIVDPIAAIRSIRTWTSADGKKVDASVLSDDGDAVVLRLRSGNTATVTRNRLAAVDLDFLDLRREIGNYFDLKPTAPNREKTTPSSLEPRDPVTAFESEHFRISSPEPIPWETYAKLADALEETRRNFLSLPIALKAFEPATGKIQVTLCPTDQSYLEKGGSNGEDAAYLTSTNEILCRSRLTKLDDIKKHAVFSLLAHWAPFLPKWIEEGLAGCASMGINSPRPRERQPEGEERLTDMIKAIETGHKDPSTGITVFPPKCPESVIVKSLLFSNVSGFGFPAAIESEANLPTPVSPIEVIPYFKGIRKMDDNNVRMVQAPVETGTTRRPAAEERFRSEQEREYVSAASICLMAELLWNESPESLRTFFAAFLLLGKERNRIIDSWNRDREEYAQRSIVLQDEFSKTLEMYAKELEKYNVEARAHWQRAHGANALPPLNSYIPDEFGLPLFKWVSGPEEGGPQKPDPPVVPKPLAVPDHLANPPSPQELSEATIWRQAYKLVKIPESLEAPYRRK